MGYAGFFMKVFRVKSKVSYPVYKIMTIHITLTILALIFVETPFIWKGVISLLFIMVLVFVILQNINENNGEKTI